MRISDGSSDVCSSDLDGGDRRYHPPARARALSRHLWRCIRTFDGPRSLDRRLFCRASELALDLLHQTAARSGSVGRHRHRLHIAGRAAAAAIDVSGAALMAIELTGVVLFTRDRQSVVSGKSVSGRVDVGGSSSIKTKKKQDKTRKK